MPSVGTGVGLSHVHPHEPPASPEKHADGAAKFDEGLHRPGTPPHTGGEPTHTTGGTENHSSVKPTGGEPTHTTGGTGSHTPAKPTGGEPTHTTGGTANNSPAKPSSGGMSSFANKMTLPLMAVTSLPALMSLPGAFQNLTHHSSGGNDPTGGAGSMGSSSPASGDGGAGGNGGAISQMPAASPSGIAPEAMGGPVGPSPEAGNNAMTTLPPDGMIPMPTSAPATMGELRKSDPEGGGMASGMGSASPQGQLQAMEAMLQRMMGQLNGN